MSHSRGSPRIYLRSRSIRIWRDGPILSTAPAGSIDVGSPAPGVEISTTSGIGGAIVDTKPGDHLLNTCGPRQIDETGRDCALGELPRR
jgi:hypothetical protein